MKGWIYVFVFLFLISFVCAENNGCCPLTNAGDSCVYTISSDCAEGFVEGALCENTDVCSIGCCVSTEGCFEGTGEYTCSINTGDFFDAQECSFLEACQMTCCKFGSDYTFMNYGECQGMIDEFGSEVQSIPVADEAACEELEDQEEQGCCVSFEGCSYITQAECGYSSYDSEGFGFFENEYCSGVASYLEDNEYAAKDYCACETTDTPVCSEDMMDVVEVDSCGNYGAVVQECNFPDEMCIMGDDGAYCGTGECYFDLPTQLEKYNPLWENDFQNYESRCLYEGPAGNYQDRPGSRHYVVRCLTGELVLEPCEDLRGEVCIDQVTNDVDYANCESNTVDSSEDEVTTVPIGEKFWEYYTSGETSESCSEARVNCNVFFGKTSFADAQRECEANCFCLRKEWSMLMAEYCNAAGDCGNDVNLNNDFSEDSFQMNRRFEYVGGGGAAHRTYVGCGDACVDDEGTVDDARGVQCYPDTDCNFYSWNKIKDDYKESLDKRISGGNFIFTLLEYVNINPNFLFIASNSNIGSDYFSIEEIILFVLDISEEGISSYLGENPDISDYSVTLSVFGNDDVGDTWLESIDLYRESLFLEQFNFEEDYSLILGPKFVLDDVTEHYAKAPEYPETVNNGLNIVNVYSACGSWVAPENGDCNLCEMPMSEGGLAIENPEGDVFIGYECSEYKCKSLGRNCEWIEGNEDTGRPVCINAEIDSTPPVITLWRNVVEELEYEYTEADDETTIVNAPLGLIQLPILTDDFSRCKISDDPLIGIPIVDDEDYSAIDAIIEDPLLGYSQEHNFTYLLSDGGKEYQFYIWCENFDLKPTPVFYMFRVTTTTEPDTDAPEVEGVYPNSATYVKNGEESLDLTIYLNENAYCKYSSQDIGYEQMTSEFASCNPSEGIFNYVCVTMIPLSTGTTSLYILCSDTAGNIMPSAEEWYVSQSLPLEIVQTSPTGILYTNEIVLQVKTEDGADNGNAVCSYEGSGISKQEMFVTSGTYHEQSLNLEKGTYAYAMSCEDYLGNSATGEINFVVDKDVNAAEITGVYYLGNYIYVLTNEATTCQYKTESFSYGNGYDMNGVATTAHTFTVSDLTVTYYINCIDAYSNTLEGVKINLEYLL